MKTTILATAVLLIGCTAAALVTKKENKTTKRDIYGSIPFYSLQIPQQIVRFDRPAVAFDGYDYPLPQGQRFEEEPVPNAIDLVIRPAIRKLPIPNADLPPGFRATMVTRRILTPVNEGLFYKYPGYIPEPGLPVRLPIANTRPTRVVVPQHGALAFGSGGLGYSYLPGGRIAIGSGSLGLSNVVLARTRPLPPRPPYPRKQTSNASRRLDVEEPSSSDSLTVFPLSAEQRLEAKIYNF